MDWFKALSQGRKFVVVWNLVLLPIVVPVLIYVLFFSGEPFPIDPFLFLAIFVSFAIAGGFISWRVFK